MSSFWSKVKNVAGDVKDGVGDVYNDLSGKTQARAIGKAGRAQAAAADRALTETSRLHEQGRQDLMPWQQRGNQAGEMLSSLFLPGGQLTKTYGGPYTAKPFSFDVNQDPGAQFRIDTANKALERGAAGKGRSMGGRAIRNVAELNQQLGSQEYGAAYSRYAGDRAYGLGEDSYNRSAFNQDQDNLFNRLFGISGQGQAAAAGQSAGNAQFGGQASDLITGMGNAQAGTYIGQANAQAGGTQALLNLLLKGGTAAAGMM